MQQLVKVTMESILNVEIPSPFIGYFFRDNGIGNGQTAASGEEWDLIQDVFAMAQRVDTTSKIAASIKWVTLRC